MSNICLFISPDYSLTRHRIQHSPVKLKVAAGTFLSCQTSVGTRRYTGTRAKHHQKRARKTTTRNKAIVMHPDSSPGCEPPSLCTTLIEYGIFNSHSSAALFPTTKGRSKLTLAQPQQRPPPVLHHVGRGRIAPIIAKTTAVAFESPIRFKRLPRREARRYTTYHPI